MNRLVLLSFASSLIACSGGDKAAPTTTAANPCGDNSCADNPCAAAANPCGDSLQVGVDWTTWQSWPLVNTEAFVSKGHNAPWVNVYVTDAEAYKAGGEMPEGFAAVKAIHKDAGGKVGEVSMLTVMAKMGSDYDPDNGNWYYAAMSADGSKAMKEGKLEACSDCHTSGDDYLFQSKVIGM